MTDESKTEEYSYCEKYDERFHADMVNWKTFLDWTRWLSALASNVILLYEVRPMGLVVASFVFAADEFDVTSVEVLVQAVGISPID